MMIKRTSDIVFSFLFLVILFPFNILIAILIRLDSRGTILYRQTRVGENNIDFTIYKFRTMVVDADKKSLITVGNRDARITRVGYILRKYKLDELPQLLNVLNGTMSFVGPRPEVRKYIELYSLEQKKVLSVKPGITDYASIEFANENELLAKATDWEKEYIQTVMPAKLALNLKYINEQSFFTDMKIIFLTIKKVAGIQSK
jgi:lipopolysaccharide/colanic/teichoic acid biosynthesis glycosyltransferase